MSPLSVSFLVIAVIAAVLGFGGIVVGVAAGMVKVLFLIFALLFLVDLMDLLIMRWIGRIGKGGDSQSR